MKKIFLALLVLLVAGVANAQAVYITQDPVLGSTGGIKILNQTINVDRWTGWINSSAMREMVFDVSYIDGAAAGVTTTAINMRCEASTSSSTGNDDGFDIHGTNVSCVGPACTATTGVLTFTYPGVFVNGATARWIWILDRLPSRFVNCLFTGTGSGATDKINVLVRGVTP